MERRNRMRLEVENFAKIKKADIEINGITVIAGENNTGKSTIGKILYCLFDGFYNISSKVNRERYLAIKDAVNDLGYFDVSIDDFVYTIDVYSQSFDDMCDELLEFYKVSSKDMDYDHIIKIIEKYFASSNENNDTNFDETTKKIMSSFQVSDDQIRKNIILKKFNLEFNNDFLPKNNKSEEKIKLNLDIKTQNIEIDFNYTVSAIIEQIHRFLPLNSQVIYIDNPSTIDYISENRRFMRMKANSEHESSLLKKLSIKNKKNIIDETINDKKINTIKKRIVDIIHGSFTISEDKKLMFKDDETSISYVISNLSTGLKSFAILLRLLDNGYIEQNACIILDEPEVHLHPDWQIKYAELLVLLQSTFNLHILINSHSPYFINAIEAYAAKYEIANKCNYYLAKLDNQMAIFENVTTNTEPVYALLAEPLRKLSKIIDEDRRI